MRLRLFGAAMLACALALAIGTAAEASPRHRSARHDSPAVSSCVYDNTAVVVCAGGGAAIHGHAKGRAGHVAKGRSGDVAVIGGRPAGCPYKFCGCEASLYVFGRIIPALNLADNWRRKFPRAHPAPGMAAARSGHVMVLISHVSGKDWLVHDGNSGGHLTREHVRSIAGYTIVDPRARTAGL